MKLLWKKVALLAAIAAVYFGLYVAHASSANDRHERETAGCEETLFRPRADDVVLRIDGSTLRGPSCVVASSIDPGPRRVDRPAFGVTLVNEHVVDGALVPHRFVADDWGHAPCSGLFSDDPGAPAVLDVRTRSSASATAYPCDRETVTFACTEEGHNETFTVRVVPRTPDFEWDVYLDAMAVFTVVIGVGGGAHQ